MKVNCSVVHDAEENQSIYSPGHLDVLCINHWKGKSGCVAYSFRYQHINIEMQQIDT